MLAGSQDGTLGQFIFSFSMKFYDFPQKVWLDEVQRSCHAMNFMIHEQMSKILLKQFSIALASALC